MYQKIRLIFEVFILSNLQLQNLHENSPCFKSRLICLKHSRKACGQVVFLFQKSFLLIKYLPNHFKFFLNFNIFQKKGSMCSKNKNTYTLLDFDIRTSLNTIIVLKL
jgi:hypothetical protein